MDLRADAGQLRSLYDSLSKPTNVAARIYSAVQIPPGAVYRIGKDSKGNAALLIKIEADDEAPQFADFEGKHLRVNHGLNCAITKDAEAIEQARFTVITCHDADDQLVDRFFEAIDAVLRSVGDKYDTANLRRIVAGLTELFQLANQPPRGAVQGLWTELWLIAYSSGPDSLLSTWHVSPTDAFDFNGGDQRIELKSSASGARHHRFSHRQLTPPGDVQAVIASVLVEAAPAGPSIADLVDTIRQRVDDPQLIMHLQRAVAETLGREWRAALHASYDAELASESLRFFAVGDIPALAQQIPTAISDLRYTVDMSGVQALTSDELYSMGAIVAAAVPASAPD